MFELENEQNFFQRQLEFYAGYAAAVPKIDLDASDLGSNIEDLPSQSSSEQEQSIAIFYKNMLNDIYNHLKSLDIDKFVTLFKSEFDIIEKKEKSIKEYN